MPEGHGDIHQKQKPITTQIRLNRTAFIIFRNATSGSLNPQHQMETWTFIQNDYKIISKLERKRVSMSGRLLATTTWPLIDVILSSSQAIRAKALIKII